jgi:hypothetical protein
MEQDRYFVVPSQDQWAVKLNHKILGTFADRNQAIRAAITAAEISGKHGLPAEVLTQAANGETHPVWTYGRDTFSPG